MKPVIIDAVCSVARHVPIKLDKLELSGTIPAVEGTVIAARISNDKKIYNRLETPNGRQIRMQKGKKYLLVLGNRAAIDGFVGHVPERVAVGDMLQILNLGGLCGICRGGTKRYVGNPFNVKVLGSVMLNGKPANIADYAPVQAAPQVTTQKKLILVFGTSMNSGKTHAACQVIESLTHAGKKVAAAKVTGAGCLKDTLRMHRHGALHTRDLVDTGLASTLTKKDTLHAAMGLINDLSVTDCEYIVIEAGDGIIGNYHGNQVIYAPEFQRKTVLAIGCAHDLTGVWGLRQLSEKHAFRLDLISGPVTDNISGTEYIEDKWQLPTANAKSNITHFRAQIRSLLKM
ncbi:MAG TPA: hypothetical protein PKL83_05055 [bacterium]|nr:hypothetical protein [bacterium]